MREAADMPAAFARVRPNITSHRLAKEWTIKLLTTIFILPITLIGGLLATSSGSEEVNKELAAAVLGQWEASSPSVVEGREDKFTVCFKPDGTATSEIVSVRAGKLSAAGTFRQNEAGDGIVHEYRITAGSPGAIGVTSAHRVKPTGQGTLEGTGVASSRGAYPVRYTKRIRPSC